MPSKSPAQARLMAAVAHGWSPPGGGGPPASVAREFNRADTGTKMLAQAQALRRPPSPAGPGRRRGAR